MTLSTQFMTMLAMIGMGSLFGASLDTYKRFLNRQKGKSWLIFINDILFWVYQGLSIFYVLFTVNQGDLRFYIFVALVCGFAAYQSLMKRTYLKVLEWMITFGISVYRLTVKVVYSLIFRPVRFLVLSIVSLILLIAKGIWGLLKVISKVFTTTIIIAWKPFRLFFLFLWKLLPKGIKKNVERLYNVMAGFMSKLKNYTSSVIKKLKSLKK